MHSNVSGVKQNGLILINISFCLSYDVKKLLDAVHADVLSIRYLTPVRIRVCG